MTIQIKPGITVQEFEQILADPANKNRLLELINGEIVEKMPTEEHSAVAGNFYFAIRLFVELRNLGRVVFEARHSVEKNNDRLPDVSFIAGERPAVKKGSIPQMPDLAIEVKSPDDSVEDMRAKAEYYLKNGTRLVLLAFPSDKQVEQLTMNTEGIIESKTFSENDTLSFGDVIPGFSMSVKDIFKT